MSFSSESELASAVVSYLEERHWDVYQEVQVNSGGAVADTRETNVVVRRRRRCREWPKVEAA